MALSYVEAVAKAEEFLRAAGYDSPELTVKSVERGIDLWFVRLDEGTYGSPEYCLVVNRETGAVFLQSEQK